MATPRNPKSGLARVRATWDKHFDSTPTCRESRCSQDAVWGGYCGRCLHRIASRERARATNAVHHLGALCAASERLRDAVVDAGPRPDLIDETGASPQLDELEEAVGAVSQLLRGIEQGGTR